MSNYILLIMHEYFEKLKNTKDIKMLGLKEIIKEAWLAIILMLTAIISIILIIFVRNRGYLWWEIFTFIISVLFLIPITQYISQKAYERRKEVYEAKIKIFRKILSEYGLYELKKIQELIVQCDLACTKYKLSKRIINTITNIGKSILVPIITFISGLAIKNLSISLTLVETTQYVTSIITGIIFFIIFAYEIKWFLEEFWDRQSIKFDTIKGLLVDISIKDFIKGDKQEMSDENCYI